MASFHGSNPYTWSTMLSTGMWYKQSIMWALKKNCKRRWSLTFFVVSDDNSSFLSTIVINVRDRVRNIVKSVLNRKKIHNACFILLYKKTPINMTFNLEHSINKTWICWMTYILLLCDNQVHKHSRFQCTHQAVTILSYITMASPGLLRIRYNGCMYAHLHL